MTGLRGAFACLRGLSPSRRATAAIAVPALIGAIGLAGAVTAPLAVAPTAARAAAAQTTARTSAAQTIAAPQASRPASDQPPDRTIFPGPARRAAVRPALSPTGIFVIDATAAAHSTGGNEPSIAVNPANPNQIAILRFTFLWPSNSDLLYSTDGGTTWADETSIPTPPGRKNAMNCPCDQTIGYGRNGTLYGTFLMVTPDEVVTGSTTNPASAKSWRWNGKPAQLTSGKRTNVDQPWLVVNRDPKKASQDDVYVGFDDLTANQGRVAVSYGSSPVNITADNNAGNQIEANTNPGLRLAADPRNGTVYALYENASGTGEPKTVTYKLNRSTDGGRTWKLSGSGNGLTVTTVKSDEGPAYKFGGVNALIGGVDHVAVDPTSGDVYVVYGQNVRGGNQIKIRRLTPNRSGGLTVGPASNVSSSTNAALPSVAVTSNGTVGVLYDTFDGKTAAGFPIFSAHLARSTDHGATFSDVVLQKFQSPQKTISSMPTQRVLGDYQEMTAVGGTFYGTFAGNTSGVPAKSPPIDAMFFEVPKSPMFSLTSSANPSVFGQPVHFTAQLRPVPDGGTVSFTVDGRPLGGAVPVSTTTGQATSASIATLKPGVHTITASYSGTANFMKATATLIQTVGKAPVTTTLRSSGPSLFGHTVTFTDTVCPALPGTSPSAAPAGTVAFTDGGFLLGTGRLTAGGGTNCSQARLSWSNLLPGTHKITASYSGDANFLGSGLETLSQVVRCVTTVSGTIHGSVHAHGESFCVINAKVHGQVLSHKGTALFVGRSQVTGSIKANHGTLVGVCGSTVHGSVMVSHSTRFVVIGDPGDDHCAANHVGRKVQLMHNSHGSELRDNHIEGMVSVIGNSGRGPFTEDTTTEIEANTIGGSLHCNHNVPPPTNDHQRNSVKGHRMGQCARL